jgi:hypothetical protein
MGPDRGGSRGAPTYLLRPARRRGGRWRNLASGLGVAVLLVFLLLVTRALKRSSRGASAIEQGASRLRAAPSRRQSWLASELDAHRVHAFYYLW